MDTSHHHEITRVGEKVLAEALNEIGRKNTAGQPFRLGAFYLGNWLTDVSQVVDPVAYAAVGANIEHVTNELINVLLSLSSSVSFATSAAKQVGWRAPEEVLNAEIYKLRDALLEANKAVFTSGKNSKLASGFESLFKVIGYAKFVLKDDGSEGEMDKESYFEIFERGFTQYFPHEHLDRPILDSEGPVLESTTATGPRNPYHCEAPDETRDLYAYLRDNIEITAGFLAGLDGGATKGRSSWASATFSEHATEFTTVDCGDPQQINDDNIEWNLQLAMLGHALHSVEDFFSHTNFVAHTNGSLPASYKRWTRSGSEHAETIAKRLKRYETGYEPNRWGELPDEAHVVSGYFDIWDTVVSLGHAVDEGFGRPHHTVKQRVDRKIEYDYKKLLRDTLEFVSTPSDTWKSSDPDDEEEKNEVVEWLRERGGTGLELLEARRASVNKTAGLLLEYHPLLKDKDERAKEAFRSAIVSLGQLVGGGITLYRAIRMFADLYKSPTKVLKELLANTAIDAVLDSAEVALKNEMYKWIAADRVGCHSLLAKDTGPEVLHDGAMDCAKAVNWYICKQLTRHTKKGMYDVTRSGETLEIRNKILEHYWIDWLELLEMFLAHPLVDMEHKAEKYDVPVRTTATIDVLTKDNLIRVAEDFKKTRYTGPGAPANYDWQLIAKANGITDEQLEKPLPSQAELHISPEGNASVRLAGLRYPGDGVRLVVPWQNHQLTLFAANATNRWWYDVIVNGHRSGREKLNHVAIPIGHTRLKDLITRKEELRDAAINAYQP